MSLTRWVPQGPRLVVVAVVVVVVVTTRVHKRNQVKPVGEWWRFPAKVTSTLPTLLTPDSVVSFSFLQQRKKRTRGKNKNQAFLLCFVFKNRGNSFKFFSSSFVFVQPAVPISWFHFYFVVLRSSSTQGGLAYSAFFHHLSISYGRHQRCRTFG